MQRHGQPSIVVRAEVVGGVAMFGASPRSTPPLVSSTRLDLSMHVGSRQRHGGTRLVPPGLLRARLDLGCSRLGARTPPGPLKGGSTAQRTGCASACVAVCPPGRVNQHA